jgi:hypothetical protein
VGQDSFEKMDELDSDDHLLTHEGRTANRDIVQFVPFRNFFSSSVRYSSTQQTHIESLLAKEVLAEVPDQVTSYMKSRGIAPMALPPANEPTMSHGGPSMGNNHLYPNDIQSTQCALEDVTFQLNHSLNVKSSAPPLTPCE